MGVTLDTPRLRLRPFRNSDLDAYAPICADPEVMRYLGTGVTLNRMDTWRSMATILGHWELLGYGMFAIETRDRGELIGRSGFLDPPGWPGFELGWVLGRPWWGHGYALEAATACREYAFDTLKRGRIISLIRPDNVRSIRVAEKLGETLAGEVEVLGSKALVYEIGKR
ncbi:MAG TPA: GNAT family N-acetyltransferase [Usitatibacter sp.]|jgi:RimJ/RimL family protein N-acetyltransferase|nr:GNAT family N-acetyltransferase [Usitatibacter sp.]